MTDLNVVTLIGRLTRDVEVKYTPTGFAVGNFALAVNRSVKKNDSWIDETSFFDITIFGKTVENLQQYLTKGKQVAVQGSLKQDRWEKDGQKFNKVCILADSIQLCSSGSGGNNNNATNNENSQQNYSNTVNSDGFSEDIPF